jgi:hypothetical protein
MSAQVILSGAEPKPYPEAFQYLYPWEKLPLSKLTVLLEETQLPIGGMLVVVVLDIVVIGIVVMFKTVVLRLVVEVDLWTTLKSKCQKSSTMTSTIPNIMYAIIPLCI